MLEWVRRETLVDVTINAIPVVILVVAVGLTLSRAPWRELSLTTAIAHFLTVFPILVLVIATYLVARAVESDIRGH